DKPVQLALAEADRRAGAADQAIAVYDRVLAADPKSLDAKEGKALALIAKGDFSTPGPLLDEVMHADPRRWKTLNAMGILLTTRNMPKEAQQYFREAQQQNPSSAAVANNLGLSLALSRNYSESVDTLKQAASMAATPFEHKRIDLNTALVLAISGNLREAKAITSRYYSGAALHNNMGLYAHLAKDDKIAKSYLNMALTESKTFYKKAWDNMQAIDEDDAPETKTPVKKTSSGEGDDSLDAIVGSTGKSKK
ncbi:MAG: hypothetical protein KGJ06_06190, partial [Pseudomonadota bacterium]|nr:hypothetical protein [Pseudomonadota bacterium]